MFSSKVCWYYSHYCKNNHEQCTLNILVLNFMINFKKSWDACSVSKIYLQNTTNWNNKFTNNLEKYYRILKCSISWQFHGQLHCHQHDKSLEHRIILKNCNILYIIIKLVKQIS